LALRVHFSSSWLRLLQITRATSVCGNAMSDAVDVGNTMPKKNHQKTVRSRVIYLLPTSSPPSSSNPELSSNFLKVYPPSLGLPPGIIWQPKTHWALPNLAQRSFIRHFKNNKFAKWYFHHLSSPIITSAFSIIKHHAEPHLYETSHLLWLPAPIGQIFAAPGGARHGSTTSRAMGCHKPRSGPCRWRSMASP
jgi:hypothetical protein